MEDEDTWPLPRYNPGSRDHLHALGVISITFANLQASIRFPLPATRSDSGNPGRATRGRLFQPHGGRSRKGDQSTGPKTRQGPRLCEGGRKCSRLLQLVPRLSQRYRSFRAVSAGVRRKAGRALYGQVDKSAPAKGAVCPVHRRQTRSIADHIRAGVVQSAEINIYMRFRNTPPEDVPSPYKPYASKPPKPLKIPEKLKTSDKP